MPGLTDESGHPLNINVDGSLNVDLAAGTQVIGHVIVDSAGNVSITSLPALPAGTNVIGHVILDSGSVSVSNFPATQPVSGSVSVSNLPGTQPVSGSVSVSNFPATQPVSGTFFPTTQPISTAPTDILNDNVAILLNEMKKHTLLLSLLAGQDISDQDVA